MKNIESKNLVEQFEKQTPIKFIDCTNKNSIQDLEPNTCYFLENIVSPDFTITLPIYVGNHAFSTFLQGNVPKEQEELFKQFLIEDKLRVIHMYINIKSTGSLIFQNEDYEIGGLRFVENFSIEPGNLYEISCLWNGYQWIVSGIKIE